jgi:hypothetical protein
VAALTLAIAAPAHAVRYQFSGDKGTSCSVDVNAGASNSIGVLSSLPWVDFSSLPKCSYDARAGGAAAGNGAGASKKACKKARRKAGKRAACKRQKHHAGSRPASRAAAVPALLDHARLTLIGPLGGALAGQETLATLPLGGYSCLLGIGADCHDYGHLAPALPFVAYVAEFAIRLTAPPGERWVSTPPGCPAGATTQCVLRSGPAVPTSG